MRQKLMLLFTIAGFTVALDQATKLWVQSHFYLGESITILPNFFNITYVKNPGAAFGFLASSNPFFRDIFFLIVPPAALVIIYMILRTVHANDRIQIFALSCVFGGAIGNYVDRLRIRFVIDYLDFHYMNYYSWPAFNVADSAIVIGITLLFILSFRKKREGPRESI